MQILCKIDVYLNPFDFHSRQFEFQEKVGANFEWKFGNLFTLF